VDFLMKRAVGGNRLPKSRVEQNRRNNHWSDQFILKSEFSTQATGSVLVSTQNLWAGVLFARNATNDSREAERSTRGKYPETVEGRKPTLLHSDHFAECHIRSCKTSKCVNKIHILPSRREVRDQNSTYEHVKRQTVLSGVPQQFHPRSSSATTKGKPLCILQRSGEDSATINSNCEIQRSGEDSARINSCFVEDEDEKNSELATTNHYLGEKSVKELTDVTGTTGVFTKEETVYIVHYLPEYSEMSTSTKD
jgi:hypothetical protein